MVPSTLLKLFMAALRFVCDREEARNLALDRCFDFEKVWPKVVGNRSRKEFQVGTRLDGILAHRDKRSVRYLGG